MVRHERQIQIFVLELLTGTPKALFRNSKLGSLALVLHLVFVGLLELLNQFYSKIRFEVFIFMIEGKDSDRRKSMQLVQDLQAHIFVGRGLYFVVDFLEVEDGPVIDNLELDVLRLDLAVFGRGLRHQIPKQIDCPIFLRKLFLKNS